MISTPAHSSSSPSPIYYVGAAADAAKSMSTPVQTGTSDVEVQVTVSYLIG